MLRKLRCSNYKAFDEETQFPLSPLTVLIGPNNGGKSTALDLVRLTSDGRELELSSSGTRLRSFDELLSGVEDDSLRLGRRMSPEISLRIGMNSVAFRLADDMSFESEFVKLGDGHMLKRREVFFHPRDRSESSRRRVFSEIYDVEPPEKRQGDLGRASLEAFDGMSDRQRGRSPDNELWFGLPWRQESSEVRTEGPDRSFPRLPIGSLSEPYQRWVSREIVLDRRFVQLCLSVLNAARDRTSGESPTDLEGGPVRFQVEQKEPVGSEAEPPPMHFQPVQTLLREDLKTPDWVPPNREGIWGEACRHVLGPIVGKIEASLEVSSAHMSSFRARPKQYYGTDDALTPLLRQYQDAHPAVREKVEEWIDVFHLGSELRVESIASGLCAPSLKQDGDWRYLADLGSGTAQLLPLILRLAAEDSTDVLLLEEPESNLHPELQSRLADLLVEVIGKGHQVLVETHSEHLVRRLQYLVAQRRCEPDHASVLYIDARKDGEGDIPQVRPLSIDGEGQLSGSFGGEFFDDATDLMAQLFRYGGKN